MSTTQRWTSADLDSLPDDGTRYEIIDGELFMSKSPHVFHQRVCMAVQGALWRWNLAEKLGEVLGVPGLIFASDNDVSPDAVWISNRRRETAIRADGKLHEAPELAIEVLSSGAANERRDRVAKLGLYSRRGVDEYWIVSWQTRSIDVFRRVEDKLILATTLRDGEVIESPLLPGFACAVSDIFWEIPSTE